MLQSEWTTAEIEVLEVIALPARQAMTGFGCGLLNLDVDIDVDVDVDVDLDGDCKAKC